MKKAISYLVFAGTSEGRQLAEFFQKNQIEKLTGIYFPYWVCDAEVEGSLTAEGNKVRFIPAGWMKYRCRPVSWN